MRPKDVFCCSGDFLPLAHETMPKTKKFANAQTSFSFLTAWFHKKVTSCKKYIFRSQ